LGRLEQTDRRHADGRYRREGDNHQMTIHSTSSRLTSSRQRSWSCAVRVEAWFAIAAAFSSVPPFLRLAAISVARSA
jgi:hypothetical protein